MPPRQLGRIEHRVPLPAQLYFCRCKFIPIPRIYGDFTGYVNLHGNSSTYRQLCGGRVIGLGFALSATSTSFGTA